MRSTIISLVLLLTVSAKLSLPLTQYEEVKQTLLQGIPVRGVFKYQYCNPSPGGAIGSLDLDHFQYFNIPLLGEESIKFSASKLITNYQGKGYAWDYVKGSIFKNGTVSMYASDVTSDEYIPIYEETMDCQLNDGSVVLRAVQLPQSTPQVLENFTSIMGALTEGRSVRVVFNYKSCDVYQGPFSTLPPDTVQVMPLDVFEYFNDPRFKDGEFFAFSANVLIKNYVGKGYLYNLNEVKVFSNNTIHINVHGLTTTKYEEQLKEYFECRIDSGTNNGAIKFITFDF